MGMDFEARLAYGWNLGSPDNSEEVFTQLDVLGLVRFLSPAAQRYLLSGKLATDEEAEEEARTSFYCGEDLAAALVLLNSDVQVPDLDFSGHGFYHTPEWAKYREAFNREAETNAFGGFEVLGVGLGRGAAFPDQSQDAA